MEPDDSKHPMRAGPFREEPFMHTYNEAQHSHASEAKAAHAGLDPKILKASRQPETQPGDAPGSLDKQKDLEHMARTKYSDTEREKQMENEGGPPKGVPKAG